MAGFGKTVLAAEAVRDAALLRQVFPGIVHVDSAIIDAIIIGNDIVLYTVQPEVLVGMKFDGWAPYRYCKNIGGFKFGSFTCIRDHYNLCTLYETITTSLVAPVYMVKGHCVCKYIAYLSYAMLCTCNHQVLLNLKMKGVDKL